MATRKSDIFGPPYSVLITIAKSFMGLMHLLPFRLVKLNYYSDLLSLETRTVIVVLSSFIRKLWLWHITTVYGLHIFGVGPFANMTIGKVTADSTDDQIEIRHLNLRR